MMIHDKTGWYMIRHADTCLAMMMRHDKAWWYLLGHDHLILPGLKFQKLPFSFRFSMVSGFSCFDLHDQTWYDMMIHDTTWWYMVRHDDTCLDMMMRHDKTWWYLLGHDHLLLPGLKFQKLPFSYRFSMVSGFPCLIRHAKTWWYIIRHDDTW